MDAFLRKIRHKPEPVDDQFCQTSEEQEAEPSERALEEDDFFAANNFAGKLAFAQGDHDSPNDCPVAVSELTYSVPYRGSQNAASRVVFEVTSAEVIKESNPSTVLPGHSGHVDYTITLTSSTGLHDIHTQVIRRYTDFEHLNKVLKKRFPGHFPSVVFPAKVIVGNFSRETIAKRSRAFEQYLTHLYSILDVRYSAEFTDFFTGENYSMALQNFVEGKYFQAIQLLEHFLPVMEKLYGNSHNSLSVAVCALVVSHAKTDHLEAANTYATLALQSLPDSPLTLPLLDMTSWLRWQLGKEKVDVEQKLQQLKDKGVNMHSALDLEQELCQIIRTGCD